MPEQRRWEDGAKVKDRRVEWKARSWTEIVKGHDSDILEKDFLPARCADCSLSSWFGNMMIQSGGMALRIACGGADLLAQ